MLDTSEFFEVMRTPKFALSQESAYVYTYLVAKALEDTNDSDIQAMRGEGYLCLKTSDEDCERLKLPRASLVRVVLNLRKTGFLDAKGSVITLGTVEASVVRLYATKSTERTRNMIPAAPAAERNDLMAQIRAAMSTNIVRQAENALTDLLTMDGKYAASGKGSPSRTLSVYWRRVYVDKYRSSYVNSCSLQVESAGFIRLYNYFDKDLEKSCKFVRWVIENWDIVELFNKPSKPTISLVVTQSVLSRLDGQYCKSLQPPAPTVADRLDRTSTPPIGSVEGWGA
jgi:hypothetical protein